MCSPGEAVRARVENAYAVLCPAVARTGHLNATLVYGKDGIEHGIPLRPELFGSPAFTTANPRLCREVAVFACMTAEAIGRLTTARWAARVRCRLLALQPDWELLLVLVAQPPGPRPTAARRPKVVLIVGWEAGASYRLLGALDGPQGCA